MALLTVDGWNKSIFKFFVFYNAFGSFQKSHCFFAFKLILVYQNFPYVFLSFVLLKDKALFVRLPKKI
jgi:hypothetical protein